MIGDVLTSSILCDNLKREFPDAVVHYMAHKHTTAVIENHPSIDRIIRFDPELRNNKFRFYHYVKELDKEEYDAIIDVYAKIETSLIALWSRSPKSIGYYKWYSAFAYTHPVKRWKESKYGLGLAIEHRLQLLQPLLNGKSMEEMIHKPKIHLTREEKQEALALMQAHGLDADEQPFMISILGSGANKSYPADHMARFLDELAAATKRAMLFNYIPNQYEQVKEIYDLCKPETRERIKLDLFANSLRGFIALLSYCKALIGNEGGAVNMAKALDIPTFSIFSPWIPKGDWAIFEDGQNRSVHLRDFQPERFNNVKSKALKAKSNELYRAYSPELIFPALKEFLQEIRG
ncbi:lipopolysaccharide heptosyltransferase family protein [Robertkochia marina]|nr:lipopolysaccharide heptosyltransferase family protein [Robertkochia marina]